MASHSVFSEKIYFFRSLGVLQWSVHSLLLQLPVAGELEHKGLDTGMRPQQRKVNCFIFRPKHYNNQPYQHNYACLLHTARLLTLSQMGGGVASGRFAWGGLYSGGSVSRGGSASRGIPLYVEPPLVM